MDIGKKMVEAAAKRDALLHACLRSAHDRGLSEVETLRWAVVEMAKRHEQMMVERIREAEQRAPTAVGPLLALASTQRGNSGPYGDKA